MEASRLFFRSSNRKTRPLDGRACDHPYLPLRVLKQLGDGGLRKIVPVSDGAPDWKLGASRIHHWNKASRSWERFRDLEPTESLVVRMILASLPLSEIAGRLRSVSSLSDAAAWETVKRLFLELAEAGFCHCSPSPDDE